MTHTQTQGADGAGAMTAEFKPGDLVLNARYDHRDAYPALGESAYVQAVDGDYLDFGQGSKLLYSLFDLATPAPAATPGVPDSLREALVEALAQHLHDEEHHLRGSGCWTWPEHADDEGYRGGGYVSITPTDVQMECREAAERITRRYEQFVAAQPAGQAGAR